MQGLWRGLGFSAKQEEARSWRMGKEAYEQKMIHHQGIKQLWESKWKFPCSISVYPFHDGKFEDFEPVFEELIERNINDGTSVEYTRAFFPTASSLTKAGDDALASSPELASELYLRAACLYRIARFPYITSFPTISCATKWEAWVLQKEVYLKAASTWTSPISEVIIPHVHASGRDRGEVPAYVRFPEKNLQGDKEGKVPVVLLMTGLDGYRPDNTARTSEFITRGWATIIVEIPGTADCPADPSDPSSSERLWDSVLDWMAKDGRFEMRKVLVWGLSSGGYHAVRAAHTHKERMRGVVAQGAGVHEFFGREWIERADGHEYPFLLSPAMAMKHGYASVEEYKSGVQKKFSLLEAGVLEKPSTRLLLVNGMHDGLMPIEDSMMLFEHGTPKEARFFDKALHMGYPMANAAVYPWMESVMMGR